MASRNCNCEDQFYQSAYVSNDGGTTNAYDVGVTSVSHFYRDAVFLPEPIRLI